MLFVVLMTLVDGILRPFREAKHKLKHSGQGVSVPFTFRGKSVYHVNTAASKIIDNFEYLEGSECVLYFLSCYMRSLSYCYSLLVYFLKKKVNGFAMKAGCGTRLVD